MWFRSQPPGSGNFPVFTSSHSVGLRSKTTDGKLIPRSRRSAKANG